MKYIAIQYNTILDEYRVTAPEGGEDAAYAMHNVNESQFPLTSQCKFYAVEEYLEI